MNLINRLRAWLCAALFFVLPAFADSDAVSRLYESSFAPNKTISSSQMNAELDQIINTLNAKIGITTNSTISGTKTFSSNITITATPSSGSHATTKTYVDNRLPINYHGSAPPVWASNTVISVAYLYERDSTDTIDIRQATPQSLDVTVSTNFDTGSVAANTWYHAYAICKADGTSAKVIFSTTDETTSGTITFPATYTIKRQLPFSFRTDGSSLVIGFQVGPGWPNRPMIYVTADHVYTSGVYPLLKKQGADTTFTTISAGMPTTSKEATFWFKAANVGTPVTQVIAFRQTGSGHVLGYQYVNTVTVGNNYNGIFPMRCLGQQIDYKVSDSNIGVDLFINGYVITEVP